MWPWLLIGLTSAAAVVPPPTPEVPAGGAGRRPSLYRPAPDVHARVLLTLEAPVLDVWVRIESGDVSAVLADLDVGEVALDLVLTATAAPIRADVLLSVAEPVLAVTVVARDRTR